MDAISLGPLLLDNRRDHSRLGALARAIARDLACGDPAAASASGEHFAAALRAHLDDEETHLFPYVEALVGDTHFTVTASLRREHDVLRSLLAELQLALAQTGIAARGDLLELEAALAQHAAREERALYPILIHAQVAVVA